MKLIAECEQVKTERESDLIIDQVLIAMSAMGLDRERTLQVGTENEIFTVYCSSHFSFQQWTLYILKLEIKTRINLKLNVGVPARDEHLQPNSEVIVAQQICASQHLVATSEMLHTLTNFLLLFFCQYLFFHV